MSCGSVDGVQVTCAAAAMPEGGAVRKTNSVLHVRIIRPDEYPAVAKVLETWSKVAEGLWHQAEQIRYEEGNSHHKRPDERIFRDCSDMCFQLKEALLGFAQWRRVRVSEDERGCIQAVALSSADDDFAERKKVEGRTYEFVHDLVTNPWNVRSPLNQDTANRVTGAGTSIIQDIARAAGGDAIFLRALPSALPFYKKLGFEKIGMGYQGRPSSGLVPMLANCATVNSICVSTAEPSSAPAVASEEPRMPKREREEEVDDAPARKKN